MAKKRNLTKAKILESARNLAEELGVQQLTFQNLAVDLGIKYLHSIITLKILLK